VSSHQREAHLSSSRRRCSSAIEARWLTRRDGCRSRALTLPAVRRQWDGVSKRSTRRKAITKVTLAVRNPRCALVTELHAVNSRGNAHAG
jgi:hypothetical protein